MAVIAQSALSPLAGKPQASAETAAMEPGTPVATDQSCGDWVRSPVHTAAVPEAVPMATQVVEVQEMSLTNPAPDRKVVSPFQVLGGMVAIADVRTVGSVPLFESRRSRRTGQRSE